MCVTDSQECPKLCVRETGAQTNGEWGRFTSFQFESTQSVSVTKPEPRTVMHMTSRHGEGAHGFLGKRETRHIRRGAKARSRLQRSVSSRVRMPGGSGRGHEQGATPTAQSRTRCREAKAEEAPGGGGGGEEAGSSLPDVAWRVCSQGRAAAEPW